MNEIKNIEDINIPERHTFFQLKHFLIGTAVTNQDKMYQCLLEMKNRKITLKAMQREIDETQDQKSLLEIDKDNFLEDNPKKKEIKLRQFQRKIDSMQEQIVSLTKKMTYIEEEYNFLKETLIAINKIEPMKDWDSEEVQLQYWNVKLTKDLSLRAIAGTPLDTQLVQTVLSMPQQTEVRKKFEALIQNNLIANKQNPQ